MRSFKPEEILNKQKHSKKIINPLKNISNIPGKKIMGGVAFLVVIVALFSFAKDYKAQNVDLKPTIQPAAQAVVQKVYAVALNINGKNEVYLQDEVTAKQVLEEVKKANMPAGDKLKLKKITIKENITMPGMLVAKTLIKDKKNAVSYLLYGNVEVKKYIAKPGDNIWLIARRNNMHVKEILAANPGLDDQHLKIGQVIYFKRPLSKINVIAILQGERKSQIPYDTEIRKDKKLRRGVEKVITEGENGTKLFKYEITSVNGIVTDKKILSKRIVEKPKTKVIASGLATRTRRIAASSRSDGGGNLIWPAHGPISSPFGYRGGGEFHTGMDIDADTGDPVVAAASGTVALAGWDGSYGKCILIDNGNGMVTRYAHLSRYSVSEGEKVGRGDYIGAVGSTGRSTGSHLHFEVIIGGEVRNPIKYLN